MSHYGCARGDAKQLFISMLNTGSAYGWQLNTLKRSKAEILPDLAFVAEFHQEMRLMQHLMLERHPETLEQARDRHSNQGASTNELRASAFAIALQTHEDTALKAVEACITETSDRVVDGLIFDGAAVRLTDDVDGAVHAGTATGVQRRDRSGATWVQALRQGEAVQGVRYRGCVGGVCRSEA